jgi:hypothetical protein
VNELLAVSVLDNVQGASVPIGTLVLPSVRVKMFVLGVELYVPHVKDPLPVPDDSVQGASVPMGTLVLPSVRVNRFELGEVLYVPQVNVSLAGLVRVQGDSVPIGILALPSVRVKMFVLASEVFAPGVEVAFVVLKTVPSELIGLPVLPLVTVTELLVALEVYVPKIEVWLGVVQGPPVPVGDKYPVELLELSPVGVVQLEVADPVPDAPEPMLEGVESEEFQPVNEELTPSFASAEALVGLCVVRVGSVREIGVLVEDRVAAAPVLLADDPVGEPVEVIPDPWEAPPGVEVRVEFQGPAHVPPSVVVEAEKSVVEAEEPEGSGSVVELFSPVQVKPPPTPSVLFQEPDVVSTVCVNENPDPGREGTGIPVPVGNGGMGRIVTEPGGSRVVLEVEFTGHGT